MSHSSLQSVSRQINTLLVGLVCIFVFFILFILNAYQFHRSQIESHNAVEAVQLKQQIKYQTTLIQTRALLNKIVKDSSAGDIKQDNQQLIKQWQLLNGMLQNKSPLFTAWLIENKNNQTLTNRTAQSSQHNLQLLRLGLAQCKAIIATLEENIINVSRQRQQLYQLIMQGTTNDSVTITRAKTHTKSSLMLDNLFAIKQSFEKLALDFSALTTKTSLDNFEKINIQADQTFSLFNALSDNNNTLLLNRELSEQVKSLHLLLFTEQRAIAKWRGHLRLISDYRNVFIRQLNALNDLIIDEDLTKLSFVVDQVTESTNYLNLLNQHIFKGENQPGFWGASIGFLLLCFWCVTRISKKINAQELNAQEHNDLELKASDDLPLSSTDSKSLTTEIANNSDSKTGDINPLIEQEYQQQICAFSQLNRIAYWQLPLRGLSPALIQVFDSFEVVDKKYSWRAYFTLGSCRELLAAARLVKSQGLMQQLTVELVTKQTVTVYINYEETLWYGTVADAKQHNKLKRNIQDLEFELIEQNKASQKAEYERNNSLNDMIIQTMLQSQNTLITTQVSQSSVQVYRQLTRMLDWIRQQQVIAQLQLSAKTLSLSDVSLIDEIHAAIINAKCEAQFQQNQILLRCDPQLISKAKLDARLFQRLILAACRLSLHGQQNAKLLFSIDVIDKNAGQQVIKVSIAVHTSKPLAALPEYLALIVTESEDTKALIKNVDIIEYFKTLLQSQHGSNLNCQLIEQGYLVSFELPLAIVDKAIYTQPAVDFKKANVALITQEQDVNDVLQGYINSADGILQTSISVATFIEHCTPEKLKSAPLKLVILASDCLADNIENLTNFIDSLALPIKPKLMVMQKSYRVPLDEQGLYSHGDYPLSQEDFLTRVASLLATNDNSNLLLNAEQCLPYQFSSTQIEVLLAVTSPQNHQLLLRVLHWLGLQVRVVSQVQAMKKHWQTGRYLVLINEFDQAPTAIASIDNATPRGFFSLSEHMQLSSGQQPYQRLPSPLNLAELTKVLSPWLIPLVNKDLTIDNHIQLSSKPSVAANADKKIINPKVKIEGVEEHEKQVTDVGKVKQTTQASFDMEQYIKHQGTSELAIFMLDEYLESNDESFDGLSAAIKEKDNAAALHALKELTQNANILAANNLLTLCHQIKLEIVNEDIDKIKALLMGIKRELCAIEKYANSL